MATTKETMEVITEGIKREEEICDIIGFFAELAAKRFLNMAEGMHYRSITALLKMLNQLAEEKRGREAVEMLQAFFLADRYEYAAEDLDVLNICENYLRDAHLWFLCSFLYDEEIRWLMDIWEDDTDSGYLVS